MGLYKGFFVFMTPVLWIGVVLATMKYHVTALLSERSEEQEASLKWSLAGKQQLIRN